jgi:hypothetical protein
MNADVEIRTARKAAGRDGSAALAEEEATTHAGDKHEPRQQAWNLIWDREQNIR